MPLVSHTAFRNLVTGVVLAMSGERRFSCETKELAKSLIKEGRLTMRQLQQGMEWCSRNEESLLTFLDRFCGLRMSHEELGAREAKAGEAPHRVFERHESRSLIWVEAGETLVEVSVLNVSRGGLAFRSRWALEAGTELCLGAEQQVVAVVRYCVDDGPGRTTVGAEFVPWTVDDLQAIESLMSSLTTRVVSS